MIPLTLPSLLPVLTASGAAMTSDNWRSIGIDTAVFYLSSLLMKPGADTLFHVGPLKTYVGWQGRLVLNVSDILVDKTGQFVVRSVYDGRKSHYSEEVLVTLVNALKPDVVVLPVGLSSAAMGLLSETIYAFVPMKELGRFERACGVFLTKDEAALNPEVIDRPTYTCGNKGAGWLESDKPAEDALKGLVHDGQAIFSIEEASMATSFIALSAQCSCPTCSLGLTRAYLHHLYRQTPLLCYRFLMQHNHFSALDVLTEA